MRAAVAVLVAGLFALLATAPAQAGRADAGLRGAGGNPIRGPVWGVYRDTRVDGPNRAVKRHRKHASLLRRTITRHPRVRWFGAWIPDRVIHRNVRSYIRNVTKGRSNVMVQMAVFRLQPWEKDACRRLPTRYEVRSYKRWINSFARAVGRTRALLILQPDLPFADCVPRGSTLPLKLVAYAARRFKRLPRTTVYIDGGAGDWAKASEVARWLRIAGVRHTRGFALNLTHYHSTRREIWYGQKILRLMSRRGIHGKRFVISTSTNGRPFSARREKRVFRRAITCSKKRKRRCVTLGIPPTTKVALKRWGFDRRTRFVAGKLVDGYLWIGRPWLIVKRNVFSLHRALRIARTTPFG